MLVFLQQLSDKITGKRPHLTQKKVLVHQNNVPTYKSAMVMAKIH